MTTVQFTQPIETPVELRHGKTILITGGASGIGAVLFGKLAAEGNTVIIGDISDGNDLVRKTREQTDNENLHYLHCDVTDFGSQQRFFREGARLGHGVINSVIVNAGIADMQDSTRFMEPPDYTSGPLDRPPPRAKTFDVNLIGAIHTVHIAIAYFSRLPPQEDTDRSLTLMGSIAGLYGLPAVPIYSVAKHALTGLWRSMRYHSADLPFRLNLICPYFIATPILGAAGNILLSGTALATLDDVTTAIKRTVTDTALDGRCYVVTPRASVAEARKLGIRVDDAAAKDTEGSDGEEEKRAIWECFDPDDVIYDDFSTRIMRLIRLRQSSYKLRLRNQRVLRVLGTGGVVALAYGLVRWWRGGRGAGGGRRG